MESRETKLPSNIILILSLVVIFVILLLQLWLAIKKPQQRS